MPASTKAEEKLKSKEVVFEIKIARQMFGLKQNIETITNTVDAEGKTNDDFDILLN